MSVMDIGSWLMDHGPWNVRLIQFIRIILFPCTKLCDKQGTCNERQVINEKY